MVWHSKVAIGGGTAATAGERLRLLLRAGNAAALREVKAELVKQNGNVTRTARALGLNYRTFVRAVHQLELEPFIARVRSAKAKQAPTSGAHLTPNSDSNVIADGAQPHLESFEEDPWPFL